MVSTLKQTRTICFTNQKGGSGKTTGAVSLSACLAELGYSTCLVDIDSQCNATTGLGVDIDLLLKEKRYTVAEAYLKKRPGTELEIHFEEESRSGLFLVPGHTGLRGVRRRLDSQLEAAMAEGEVSEVGADDLRNEHRHRLKKSLEALKGTRDFIIIDTPPDLDFLLTSALIAADFYIVPVFPSGYDLKGLEQLQRTIGQVRKRYNPELKLLGVLLGSFDMRATLDRQIKEMLADQFSANGIFDTAVGRGVRHRESPAYGRTILEHAPSEQAAEQYRGLAREVLERLASENERPLPERGTFPEREDLDTLPEGEEVANA